jgi:hypothetical protein
VCVCVYVCVCVREREREREIQIHKYWEKERQRQPETDPWNRITDSWVDGGHRKHHNSPKDAGPVDFAGGKK